MNPLTLGLGAVIDSVGKIAGDLYTSDKERLELGLRSRELDQAGDMAQIEVNKVEAASQHWFTSGWRPGAGWVCVGGFAYQALLHPLMSWAWQIGLALGWLPAGAIAPPALDITSLEVLLYGLLGLGVYRTAERIRGKA